MQIELHTNIKKCTNVGKKNVIDSICAHSPGQIWSLVYFFQLPYLAVWRFSKIYAHIYLFHFFFALHTHCHTVMNCQIVKNTLFWNFEKYAYNIDQKRNFFPSTIKFLTLLFGLTVFLQAILFILCILTSLEPIAANTNILINTCCKYKFELFLTCFN